MPVPGKSVRAEDGTEAGRATMSRTSRPSRSATPASGSLPRPVPGRPVRPEGGGERESAPEESP